MRGLIILLGILACMACGRRLGPQDGETQLPIEKMYVEPGSFLKIEGSKSTIAPIIARGSQDPLQALSAFLAFNAPLKPPAGPRVHFYASSRNLAGWGGPPGAACIHAARVAQSPCARCNLADQRVQAYEWMSTLGAPAALVAGASLASVFELSQDLEVRQGEKYWVSIVKVIGKTLFLSAFAMNIACVYTTTVTGTMLLGKGVPNPLAGSACFMLQRELEFEYLFSRIAFFQGLLNWLTGVAVHQSLPKKNATKASIHQQCSAGAGIMTMVIYMVAFYNKHISYYRDYGHMLSRLFVLWFRRYYGLDFGFRILPAIAVIPAFLCVYFGARSLTELQESPE